MSIPEFIKLGDYEVHYKEINDYQKSIYEMLAFYVHMLERTAVDITGIEEDEKEYLRNAGVVRFLKNRLKEYGDVKKVPRDLYDSLEAQLRVIHDSPELW
jgi:hypothetical protein